MSTQAYVHIALELWGIFLCTAIAICVAIQHRKNISGFRNMGTSAVFTILLLLSDIFAIAFRGHSGTAAFYIVRIANYSTFLCTALLIIAVITYYEHNVIQAPETHKWHVFARCINRLSYIFLAANPFCHLFFRFDDNLYSRGPLWILLVVIALVSMIIEFIVLIIHRKDVDKARIIPMFAYFTLPEVAAVIQSFFYGYSLINISFAMSCILLFLVTGMENALLAAEQERKITEANTKIMLTQIQPHFLFNALTAIQFLCTSEPEEAAETVGNLSTYLRNNIDFSASSKLIPFTKELSHVESYVAIEKKRFGDRVKMEYDVEYEDFWLPPLLLQPMVENAVKHGIRKRPEGGTIRLSVREANHHVTISISDNGVGFDDSVKPSEDRSHIGVSSVQDRVEKLCHGTFHIASEIGKGTTVTIVIPANLRNEE